jgi:hypothetical protein
MLVATPRADCGSCLPEEELPMSGTLGALDGRIAAAPISWGICEVPAGAR